MSLLKCVQRYGEVEELIQLIESGSNVNEKDRNGQTPLHYCISFDIRIVEKLLQHGADPNMKNRIGISPFHDAAYFADEEFISISLNYGADLNLRDNSLATPLHYAVKGFYLGGSSALVCLLQHGADPNIKNKDGETPFDYASKNNLIEACCILVEYGAIVNIDLLETFPENIQKMILDKVPIEIKEPEES